MKLAKLPFLDKKEKPEYYLALILQNEKAISVIFEKIGDSIKYISHDEEDFENTIEDATTEQFLEVLDKVITRAETALPNNIETQNTIFGLKENWIEDTKIKKEYLDKLKKACDELGLTPIGFLVFSESIINLLQKDEGAPITAILANIGKKYITASLVKSGKIVETRFSEIHQSPAYTVDTLLKHFQTPEVMPARVIILSSDEEDLTQEFIGHQWSKSLPFLHLPQIVALPKDAPVKAMLLGAATQMNASLLYDSSKFDFDEEPQETKPEEIEKPTEAIENPVVKDLKEEPSAPPLDYVGEEDSQAFFGFVENEDIAKTKIEKEKIEEKLPENLANEVTEVMPETVALSEEEQIPTPVNAALVTDKIKKFFASLPLLFKKIKFDKLFGLILNSTGGNKKLLIIPAVIILLLVAVLYFYLFKTKAAVTILVAPKAAQNSTSVTFTSGSPTDITKKVIAAEQVTVSEDGSITLPATGKKDVGNSAKGTVTVFNSSDSTQNFPAGTTIKTSSGLQFTIDKAITVASASGDIFSGTTPGTASVSVTASDIGQEYNLPSATKFAFGSSTSVAAKNDNAFSGGSKKQVTVVSKDDLQKLLDSLPKQLEAKARSDIKAKASTDKSILPNFVSETVNNKSFDKKADDAASQVTLKGSVDFATVSYKNSDILSFVSSLFDSATTKVSKDNFSVNATKINVEKNNDITANLDLKVNLLPNFDQSTLVKQVAGNSLTKARNILSNLPQVENVGIVLSPNIPFLPQNMPGDPNRITISVTSQ